MILNINVCAEFVEPRFLFRAVVRVVSGLFFLWRFNVNSIFSELDVVLFWRHHLFAKFINIAMHFFWSLNKIKLLPMQVNISLTNSGSYGSNFITWRIELCSLLVGMVKLSQLKVAVSHCVLDTSSVHEEFIPILELILQVRLMLYTLLIYEITG